MAFLPADQKWLLKAAKLLPGISQDHAQFLFFTSTPAAYIEDCTTRRFMGFSTFYFQLLAHWCFVHFFEKQHGIQSSSLLIKQQSGVLGKTV